MKILIYIFCAFCIAIITPLFTSQVSVSSHYPSSAAMASLLQAGITVFIFWLFFFVIAKAMIRKWESRKSRSGTKKKDPESCNVDPLAARSTPQPLSSNPNCSLPWHTCCMLWEEAFSFAEEFTKPINCKAVSLLWTAYFCYIVRIIRNRNAANDIYSHFDDTLHAVTSQHPFPELDPERLRYEYQWYNSIDFNSLRFDPTTKKGKGILWGWVETRLRKQLKRSGAARRHFFKTLQSLDPICLELQSYNKSQNPGVQFSISSDGDDTAIPELPH